MRPRLPRLVADIDPALHDVALSSLQEGDGMRRERRLGWVTENQQRYPPDQPAEDAQAALRAGVCPICGSGPFTVVAIHVAKKHGVDRFEIRAMADLPPRESICDPTHSASVSARTRRTSEAGWEEGGHLRAAQDRHLAEIAARTEQMAALFESGHTIKQIATVMDLHGNSVRNWLHRLGYVTDARTKGSPSWRAKQGVKLGPRPKADACKAGHPYTAETTYTSPTSGKRSCRICMRARDRKRPSGSVRQRMARLSVEARDA